LKIFELKSQATPGVLVVSFAPANAGYGLHFCSLKISDTLHFVRSQICSRVLSVTFCSPSSIRCSVESESPIFLESRKIVWNRFTEHCDAVMRENHGTFMWRINRWRWSSKKHGIYWPNSILHASQHTPLAAKFRKNQNGGVFNCVQKNKTAANAPMSLVGVIRIGKNPRNGVS
jgi:hypothetical protein